MRKPGSVDVGVAFEGGAGPRVEPARRAILSLPGLLGEGLAECELAVDGMSLLAALRLYQSSPERIERLRFWCAHGGGEVAVLEGFSPPAAASWRARLAGAKRRRRCALLKDIPAAVDELLERDRGAEPLAAATLDVDIGGPGSEGVAFDSAAGLLFIPGTVAPPQGDEFGVMLRVRGANTTARFRARVVQVRAATQAAPGAPAGFVLQLGVPPPDVAAALAACCSVMNADAIVAEARRTAPRYAVRAPVDVELQQPLPNGDTGQPERNLSLGCVVTLAMGGAFVESDDPAPPGTPLSLRIHLAGEERFETAATVVYATAAGVGVKFHLDAPNEALLSGLVARIAARPRRALVADDDALARRMLGDSLAARGYEVLYAASCDEALQVLASELYALDVVVTALQMKGLDGSRLVQAVISGRQRIPISVVAVTARMDPGADALLRAAGVEGVLSKGLGAERIGAAVDAWVARQLAAGTGQRVEASGAYEPPRGRSYGVVFDRVETGGAEVKVHLAPGFFSLPPRLRAPVLQMLLAHHAGVDPTSRALLLFAPREAAPIGRFSREGGFELAGSAGGVTPVPSPLRSARSARDS